MQPLLAHARSALGGQALAAQGNLTEKHPGEAVPCRDPGEPAPEGSTRVFYMEIQEQNLCLSHPSSELLLPEWDTCFLRGRSS